MQRSLHIFAALVAVAPVAPELGGIAGWCMESFACVNVRSGDCAPVGRPGQRIVRYRGEEYYVIGLYFGRDPDGRLELHFILSSVQGQLQLTRKLN